MESPIIHSPVHSSGPPSRSRSSTKVGDDVTSLTSFNPFSEEDENDQSSYALVTSLFSRMKSSFSVPLSSAAPSSITQPNGTAGAEQRRPSATALHNTQSSFSSRSSAADRPNSLSVLPSNPAPPLVSLTPVVSEAPSFTVDYDRSPSRGPLYTPVYETPDGGMFGTAIPGFPIQDDTRSIRTSVSASIHRSASVSKVIRRIRGEGQIFCSRCASNIIKGSRFGHDGMVRVCNLCLGKLAKVDDDDDDDQRSIISSTTSPFPAHQLGVDSFMMGLNHHPQSPFAASQLFGRTDEPFNLYSIAETKRPISGSDDSGFGSRPITPREIDGMWDPGSTWEPVREITAPFRRNLADEEKDPVTSSSAFNDHSPTAPGSKTPIDFPVMVPVSEGPMSSIQFPMSSPDQHGPDSPGGTSMMRSRFNSFGDFDVATPFIRSRVQSRLDQFISMDAGWRTRRDSTARCFRYAQELNLISMFHLRIMLRQMLSTEQIPNIKEWEETLLRLALRIARELTFTALPHHQGEDMDVRRYVKIKKIPGGSPSDSEYVDGAVITKNVAHKQMSRFQKNPRVMFVTFPLEFHRVEGQYVHFGQILRQEKEYLGNLASRIAALRPHIVIVEKSVSRIALEALAEHNIAVARSVKPSAIQFVARMTQADVFSSMDKLALERRLGHCKRFRIQTFDHHLIPGRRKTYMRFEGCSRDMGCTIILRGGDFETLRRVKKVTRFLTFIVRNLKLETHLWKDSVITLPSLTAEAIPASPSRQITGASGSQSLVPASISSARLIVSSDEVESTLNVFQTESTAEEDLPDDEAEQMRLSKRIHQSLEPYTKTFISVSATLRFPPPQPLRRMKELDDELMYVKRAWEDEVVRREEQGHKGHIMEMSVTPMPIIEATHDADDVKAQIEALHLPDMPGTPLLSQTGLSDVAEAPSGYFDPQPNSSPHIFPQSTLITSPMILSPRMEEPQLPLKTAADISLESQLSLVKWQHEEQRRIWEWYLRKNSDDFVVEKYQRISLWEYTMPIAEFGLHRACFAPHLNYITFYGEKDCTLGQYIEKSVSDTLVQFLDPKAICTGKGCTQPLARHCKVYVHNETRLFVAVEQWDGQIKGRNVHPSPELITTWSACRVCGSATPFIPVSEEMQRYSFAKFLELHFYPADVQLVQGAGCQHNIYQHHIRYFASKGMTVRFQADPILLHEVVYPPMRIRVRPETQLELKNADFERLHRRNLMWYTALVDDLKLISIDASTGDEEHDARLTVDINILISRAEAEREEISNLINRIYKESSPTDTLALNHIRSYRQDKIVAWQQDFDKLPKPRPANTLDRNSRRVSAFGSVRAMWPKKYDLPSAFGDLHIPSSSVSEAEGGRLSMRRVTGDSFTSSASEASEVEPETTCEPAQAGKDAISEMKLEPSLTAPREIFPEDSYIPVATKNDPDSDSTIGAAKDDGILSDQAPISASQVRKTITFEPNGDRTVEQMSRLPRRATQNPSVAELVKKYQDFLPPQGVQELAKTALAPPPPVSESDQESVIMPYPRTLRSKSRRHGPSKKPSISDFEQSYAVNVASRYLTYNRRSLGQGPQASRIPGPIGSSVESQPPSRRASPDKRSAKTLTDGSSKLGRTSPPSGSKAPVPPTTVARNMRGKPPARGFPKDKASSRPPSSSGTKPGFRRAPVGTGSKVSNIARHFERINRDTEKANRRYAVIRGKRARPVASAKATVEVLDSIKDAIKDESESSDSSSEADDEGGDEDEGRKSSDKTTLDSSPEQSATLPEVKVQPEVTDNSNPAPNTLDNSNDVISTVPQSQVLLPRPIVQPEPQTKVPASPFLSSTPACQNPPSTPLTPDMDIIGGGTERGSIFKAALSGLWPQQFPQPRRVEFEGDDPMSDPEHIFRDSSMVVRTDEPTSIIALALNSPQYRDMLARSRAEKRIAREPKLTDGGEAFMPDDRSVAESTSTWGVVNVESADCANPTDELKSASSKLPWAISFESGGLTISCTVLYPEHFDALRRTYDCEKSIIESLARCVKWNASGGKSGSAFLKTRDDRFIAKELSRPELQTMETFAPAYFDYMASAVTGNRPTLLAKVFGCYKITFKKTKDKGSSKSKLTQMNLVVMENLFYDRRFSKIYDLKGSTRNRHVQSTGRENEVLLDENLVETAHLSPFYLREHSKRVLRGALYNDSKFLADINVMDYSLVVGVDNIKNELVVGIVDYIRTYTWDKKLESWVKESAFMGGAGRGEPTIVTPKQYRQRFISAMERYFPLVPDRWMKQKDTSEEDPRSLAELWPDW
ncbi:hypothetical protein SERLADRAFT_353741 [Serpula lacrymans var. lacrymans S7.9]|uniref:1-phosphatidylinositol-3-phosphate 5-kinase n=1 Tax=Serpula lacrymans var. lacrymans (strain S7.9) TaxID=578457 RepID=F8NEU9_SERL9|nr:uncharacterized protein SERLADRAFT_353741 [Serpula lacrymans var. lacrymans S7.9]EGO31097.1 hypothetical protein SERLADRAFT_353741 [Serpula lacrymans var. lacrymans S7.9]